jgi:hypothetical protein
MLKHRNCGAPLVNGTRRDLGLDKALILMEIENKNPPYRKKNYTISCAETVRIKCKDEHRTHLKKIKHLLTYVFLSDCSTSLLHFVWMDTKGCPPVSFLNTGSCNKICEGN